MGEYGDIVIIGGSAAGVAAAAAIAEADHRGTTVLITAEERLPYKRTKVSKSFAKGFGQDAFALQDLSWFMVNDEARQRQYNQAVVEGWERRTFERAFL